mmetsp:Transcript_22307/g.51057  ORF Transcript_22307/g.51057 Transcript_22307/m.51057 type:complete len:1390 (-) Transcript_22307:110-4279(-)
MGLDVSHFEAPKSWPCLSWGEDVLQRFIDCVKQNEEGTFRITKWGMVEVVGKDKLSEVADLFTVMEESGENSVSSLQLAVALVLCNEHASPSFKASQCFMLFDWAEKGMLGFSDLLCLLQSCTKALAQCMHSAFDHVSRDDLETLCHAAMSAAGGSGPEEGAVTTVPVQTLTEWALADHRTASVLLHLSPNDHGVALVPSALSKTFTRFRGGALGELGQDGGATGDIADQGQGQLQDASRQDQMDEVLDKSLMDPEQVEGEPPLLQAVVAGADAASAAKFSADMQCILQGLQRHLGIGALLEDTHANSRGLTSPALRGREIDMRWARLLGEAMVTMSTSSSSPLDCAPFYPTVAPELLHHALRDWFPLNNACLVHEAQQQVALVAGTQLGTVPLVAPSLQAAAQKLAAEQLAELLMALSKEKPEVVLDALEAELNKVIEGALPAARALYQAQLGELPALNERRKFATRLEGAVSYLADAAEAIARGGAGGSAAQGEGLSSEGSKQLGQLRARAGDLLGQLQTAAKAREDIDTSIRDQWELYLSSLLLSSALREALSDASSGGAQALEVLAEDVREWTCGNTKCKRTDLPEAKWFEDIASTGQNIIAETEDFWLRSEGKLIAVRALVRGQSVRYELGVQKVENARRATQDVLASQYLMQIAPAGEERACALAAARASPKQLTALEHLLRVLGDCSDTDVPGQLADELLAKALSDASDASKDVALEPPAVEAAVAKDPPDDGDQEALSSQEQAPEAADVTSIVPEPVKPPIRTSSAEDSQLEDGSTLLMDLRALRFRKRSLEAAVLVVHDLLNDGTMAGIDDLLRQKLTEVSEKLSTREAMPAAQQRRQSKVKEAYAALLQELCEGASTVDSTAARMRRHAFEMYSSVLTSQWLGTARSCRTPASSREGRQALPLRRQSCIPTCIGDAGVAIDPRAWQPSVGNGLGHVSSSRHAHAAYLQGSMLGLEIVELAAVMSVSWPKITQAGEREMLEDMPVLLRLSELSSESKFLMHVAEHHLMQCTTSIIQLATGLDARSHAPGTRTGSKAGDQFLGSSTDFSNEVVRLSKAAEAVVLDLMPGDVVHSLMTLTTELVLEQKQDMLHGLQASFEEVVGPIGGETAALTIAPIWQWWRDDSMGASALAPTAAPGDSCMQWSQHVWRAWRLPNSSGELSAETQRLLDGNLKDLALALRLWCYAQHRALALEAVANRGWGVAIPRYLSKCRLRLVEVLRRTSLCQLAVGGFAATQQACTRSEMAFLQTLRPEHVHDTDVADLEARAKQLVEVAAPTCRGSATGVTPLAAGMPNLQATLLEGIQDGLEQLTSKQKVMDDGAQAKLHVQATACKELQEEPSSQGKAGAGRHGHADRGSSREARWGSLRAMQHMRACLLSAK